MRLGDIDALRDVLQRLAYDDWNQVVTTTWAEAYGEIAELVADTTPTVDAVEVIRCKECKWYGEPGCAIRIVDDTDKPSDMDFCSFSERKEGEE